MVPEVTTCSHCGRSVLVLSWESPHDAAGGLMAVEQTPGLSMFCKIDCPACGPRIQKVEPGRDSALAKLAGSPAA